jgi:hypothetical protein
MEHSSEEQISLPTPQKVDEAKDVADMKLLELSNLCEKVTFEMIQALSMIETPPDYFQTRVAVLFKTLSKKQKVFGLFLLTFSCFPTGDIAKSAVYKVSYTDAQRLADTIKLLFQGGKEDEEKKEDKVLSVCFSTGINLKATPDDNTAKKELIKVSIDFLSVLQQISKRNPSR